MSEKLKEGGKKAKTGPKRQIKGMEIMPVRHESLDLFLRTTHTP